MEETVYDRACRTACGNSVYAGRLRYLPSAVPLTQYFGRLQPVLGASLDVRQLWIHEFYMDMAMDLKGQAPFHMVVSYPALVVCLPATCRHFHTARYGKHRHSAYHRGISRLHGHHIAYRIPRPYPV